MTATPLPTKQWHLLVPTLHFPSPLPPLHSKLRRSEQEGIKREIRGIFTLQCEMGRLPRWRPR